jgi:NAD(P)-dependent dehydrogenase (short-subunit alcohol dehydrogenase family)
LTRCLLLLVPVVNFEAGTAMDHGSENIRVNAVCPGTIDTPATTKHAQKLGITKEELTKEIVKDHFIKRLGTTEGIISPLAILNAFRCCKRCPVFSFQRKLFYIWRHSLC